MTEHTRTVHAECHLSNCPICDGGLFHCEVCGQAEGEMTPECPGRDVFKFCRCCKAPPSAPCYFTHAGSTQ